MFKNIKRISFIRKVIATVIFLLFLWLLCITRYDILLYQSYPVNIFFKIDSFAILTTFIASRTFDLYLFLSGLILILATLIFGRFFCSWICPLGYLNQLISKFKLQKQKPTFASGQYFKYYLLTFIAVLSILGIQIAGIFDPLSIITRLFAIIVYPAGGSGFDSFLSLINLTPALSSTESFLRGIYASIFSPGDYTYKYGIVSGLIFFFIIGMNFFRQRFWCNYVCPLGAMLGLLSRYSLFKVVQDSTSCTHCQICKTNCHGNAEPDVAGGLKHSECMLCGNCLDDCQQQGLKYGFALNLMQNNFQPQRRHFLIASGLALITLPIARFSEAKTASLIRPPGSRVEPAFLDKCISCGECLKVCPNNAIHLTFAEGGFEGIFTPFIIPEIAYCEYYCNLCSQVCPTGAIKKISIEEKSIIAIGKASINKKLCYPYALNKPCLICEEHCPVPEKAIKLNFEGNLAKPYIDSSLCIGCGMCEYKCPVSPIAAIQVKPEGADRFK